MLDRNFLRSNPEALREALGKRKAAFAIEEFVQISQKLRDIVKIEEELRAESNQISKAVGEKFRSKPIDTAAVDELKARATQIKDKVQSLEDERKIYEEKERDMLLQIPNFPHESVPVGAGECDNPVVRKFGEPRKFDFEPRAHWDIGESLGLIDFERAVKISMTRFALLAGAGAALERAIINFMLDLHTQKHGYTEIFPPFLVNRDSMTGTGQLPKFEDESFRCDDVDMFLIPTAEVPVTNIYRDEIIPGDKLPVKFVAYTACFRKEAGSHGRDVRGLIRQHQFNKVELVKFVHPDASYDELETLTRDAEEVLQILEIPYRVVALCTGDLGFSSAKTYDIEAWMPGQGAYREISSCFNFVDFQARRMQIRFRPGEKAKPQLVHTLNGSGLAVGRTTIAVLENFQQADGTVIVPQALRKYMNGLEVIKPIEKRL